MTGMGLMLTQPNTFSKKAHVSIKGHQKDNWIELSLAAVTEARLAEINIEKRLLSSAKKP